MIRYRAEAAAAFVALPLEEFRLVYHRPSGQTHILASPAAEIFEALAEIGGEGEADAQGVLEQLRRRFDLAEGGVDEIAAQCDALVALGLARAIR